METCCHNLRKLTQCSVQLSSVTQLCLTLCYSMDCSTPGFRVHHWLPELAQTQVHWPSGAIQPSHPLSSPSPPAFSLSQHQCLFQWDSSSHQVAKVLEFQLQHQSVQWIFSTDSFRIEWFDLLAVQGPGVWEGKHLPGSVNMDVVRRESFIKASPFKTKPSEDAEPSFIFPELKLNCEP